MFLSIFLYYLLYFLLYVLSFGSEQAHRTGGDTMTTRASGSSGSCAGPPGSSWHLRTMILLNAARKRIQHSIQKGSAAFAEGVEVNSKKYNKYKNTPKIIVLTLKYKKLEKKPYFFNTRIKNIYLHTKKLQNNTKILKNIY